MWGEIMTISERVFSLLDEKGLKAAGLCKVLGVGTNQTTSWKKSNTDPPAKFIPQISEFLGVSMEFLLTGEQRTTIEDLTGDEIWFINKLRSLDEDGIVAVRGVALNESRRVNLEKGTETDAVTA